MWCDIVVIIDVNSAYVIIVCSPCHNLVARKERRSTNEFTTSTQPVEYQRASTPALRVQPAGLAQKNAEGNSVLEKAKPEREQGGWRKTPKRSINVKGTAKP